MVASFEWYDLLDKADECARTGNDHSLAHAYVEAHAARRKQLHQEWTDLPRNTPGWRPWAELWGVQYIAEGIFDAWRNPPGSEDDSDEEGGGPDHEQVPVQPQQDPKPNAVCAHAPCVEGYPLGARLQTRRAT